MVLTVIRNYYSYVELKFSDHMLKQERKWKNWKSERNTYKSVFWVGKCMKRKEKKMYSQDFLYSHEKIQFHQRCSTSMPHEGNKLYMNSRHEYTMRGRSAYKRPLWKEPPASANLLAWINIDLIVKGCLMPGRDVTALLIMVGWKCWMRIIEMNQSE